MRYKCHFPLCDYSTEDRNLIDFHHVTPREINPETKATIAFCKNHHSLIFHPESKHGQHSIKHQESIEILSIYSSTGGQSLHYQDCRDKKFYYFFESKEIIED